MIKHLQGTRWWLERPLSHSPSFRKSSWLELVLGYKRQIHLEPSEYLNKRLPLLRLMLTLEIGNKQ